MFIESGGGNCKTKPANPTRMEKNEPQKQVYLLYWEKHKYSRMMQFINNTLISAQ